MNGSEAFTTPIHGRPGSIYRGDADPANQVGAVYRYGTKWLAFHGDEPGVAFEWWNEACEFVVFRAQGWTEAVTP